MNETADISESDAINTYWNELVRPGSGRTKVTPALDPGLARLMVRLHAAAGEITAPDDMWTGAAPIRHERVSMVREAPRTSDRGIGRGHPVGRVASVLAMAAVVLVAIGGMLVTSGLLGGANGPIPGVGAMTTGQDIGRSGAIEGVAPSSGARLLWQVKVTADTSGPPAIGDGFVVAGLEDGTLLALDLTTGEERWRRSFPAHSVGALAVVDNVVLAPVDGRLLVLSGNDGTTYWSADGISTNSLPIVDRGRVFVVSMLGGGTRTGLICFELATGKELWRNDRPTGAVQGQIAAGNDLVYAKVDDTTIVAVDAATGELTWRQLTSGEVTPPVVSGDTVYVGGYKGVLAIDAVSGVFRWRRTGAPAGGSSDGDRTEAPAVGEGLILAPVNEQTIRAMDAQTGEPRWVLAMDHSVGSPRIAGGQAFVLYSGNVQALDRTTGEWTWGLPQDDMSTSFAIAGETLVVAEKVLPSLAAFALEPVTPDLSTS